MESQKVSLKLFLKHPEFPLAVVPVNANKPSEPDFTTNPHYHDFLELVVITDSSGIQWINGVEYPVSAGDVFVLPTSTSWIPRCGPPYPALQADWKSMRRV